MRRLRRIGNVCGLLGTILKWFSLVFLVPIPFALWHGTSLLPFAIPLLVTLAVGILFERRFPDTDLEAIDGFLLVVLTWLIVSALGAIPYIVAGNDTVAHPLNAFFESVSGFTCTGSTVMGEISLQTHSHAIMIWRQLTQWLGGMGILVLAVAILPRLSVGGAQFLDNEVPGPRMDRLTPHIAETARRLWLLYLGASILLFLLLLGVHFAGIDPEMDPFQALAHTMTTIPSGGFSPQGRSVEAFGAVVQWLLIPFMLVAGMNFALLWRAIFTGPTELAKDTEFKVYITVFVLSGLILGALLLLSAHYDGGEHTFRQAFFQIATILTSTGFASTDFALWPGEAMIILFVLMFSCGCIGSTSGGVKVMRWIVGAKVIYREVFQQIHPHAVRHLRLSGRVLKEKVTRSVLILIAAYFLLFAVSVVIVAIDSTLAGLDLPTLDLFSAVAATLGNIGPGVGQVGPMENFEFLPPVTKIWMCFIMITGRLEIMTVFVLLLPEFWRD